MPEYLVIGSKYLVAIVLLFIMAIMTSWLEHSLGIEIKGTTGSKITIIVIWKLGGALILALVLWVRNA